MPKIFRSPKLRRSIVLRMVDLTTILSLLLSLFSGAISSLPTVAAVEDNCPDPWILDFETDAAGNPLKAGDIITGQWASVGIQFSTNDPTNHPLMVFDSSNPSGGDFDLGSPNEDFSGPGIGDGGGLGESGENSLSHLNTLIISEDADSSDPDDNNGGGTIIVTFDHDVRIDAVEILDIDNNEVAGTIHTFDVSNNPISTRRFNYQVQL